MADITRRTFANLRTEAIKRLGHAAAGATYLARVEHLIYSAYLELGLTFFHDELVKFDNTTLTASTSSPVLALPTDCYVPMDVTLRNAAGTAFIKHLRAVGFHAQAMNDPTTTATAEPKEWARRGANLWFDVVPNLAYKVDLVYYKTPDTIDFTGSDVSELHWLFDELILQRALALGWPTRWRFDLEMVQRELLTEVLGRTLHEPIKESLLSPIGPRPVDDVAVGRQKG